MAVAYGEYIPFTAGGCVMLQPAIDFRVNPSDQTIRLGPLAVRFLITGENSMAASLPLKLVFPVDST
jgi:hypothetical protein